MTQDDQTPDRGDLEVQLERIHRAARTNIIQSAGKHAAQLGSVLQLDADVASWEAALTDRPECQVLALGRRELGFTVYSAACGLYLQAFANLRVFLELSFASVAFSVDDLRRRQWLANDTSFSWNAATDPDTGLFSPQFVRAYRSEALAEAPAFRDLAIKTYRHCSEFVHGKMMFVNTLPTTLVYSDSALTDWATTAKSAARTVLFLLYCRYGGDLMASDSGHLTQTLAHNLGHLKSVRHLMGQPVDDGVPSGSL